ncbi:MAG: hypothetical protein ISS35_10170 [Kiritimatiellae bacterium]|nr:hypothetical protein [Kiritimatiellia bacterium]
MIRFTRCLLVSLLLAACSILISGCEDDGGGGGLGGDHDFGENDASLYVAYGDSITYGVGLASSESYPQQLSGTLGTAVINAGTPGRLATQATGSAVSVLDNYKPGYMLILFGANDIIFGYGTDAIVEDLRTIVQAAKNNQTIPVLATLTPAYDDYSYMQGAIDELNPKIKQMAKEEDVRVADLGKPFADDPTLMQSDGLHPTALGAAKIAETFGRILQ